MVQGGRHVTLNYYNRETGRKRMIEKEIRSGIESGERKYEKTVRPLPPSDLVSSTGQSLFFGSLNLGLNMIQVWVFGLDCIGLHSGFGLDLVLSKVLVLDPLKHNWINLGIQPSCYLVKLIKSRLTQSNNHIKYNNGNIKNTKI